MQDIFISKIKYAAQENFKINFAQFTRNQPHFHIHSHAAFNGMIALWLIVGLFVQAATNHVPLFSNEILVVEVKEEEPIGKFNFCFSFFCVLFDVLIIYLSCQVIYVFICHFLNLTEKLLS